MGAMPRPFGFSTVPSEYLVSDPWLPLLKRTKDMLIRMSVPYPLAAISSSASRLRAGFFADYVSFRALEGRGVSIYGHMLQGYESTGVK